MAQGRNTECNCITKASTKKLGADQIWRVAGDTSALSTNIHYDRRGGKEADERKKGSGK
jgi:hypothetical protein